MNKKLIPVLMVILGSILALFCVGWSLSGKWSLPEKVALLEMAPLSKKEVSPKLVLSFDPKEKTVYQGEVFMVNILAESEEKLLAVDLFIAFDPQALELENIKPGGFFASAKEFSQKIDPVEGEVFYALGSLEPAEGEGILASLTFKAKTESRQGSIWIGEKTLISAKEDQKVDIQLPDAGKYPILERKQ